MDEFLQRQQGAFWIIAQMHVRHTQPGFCECPEITFGLSSLDHAEPGVMSGDYGDARYFDYCHRWCTHLSLEMESPESRSVQLPAPGKVVQCPEAGGLHHYYERLAA